jgi:copper chaperone
MKEITLNIGGMSCQHCVKRIEKALAALAGISKADVTVGKAVVSFDESKTAEREIKQAIETAGYTIL